MRLLVVMNPSACDFEAERRWPKMEPLLRSRAEITLLKTDPDGELTRQRIGQMVSQQNPDRVLAIGGDGTVQMVVESVIRAAPKTLPQFAVIPFGTANNVARTLGLPLQNPDEQARIAVGEKLTGLDVCTLETRLGNDKRTHVWTNCVSIGMDADVVATRAHYRGLGKWMSYAAAMAERTIEQRSMELAFDVDGARDALRVFNVIITNVPLYAGTLTMPGAKMNDGVLDAYLFDRNEYVSKLLTFAMKKTDVLHLGVSDALETITQNQRELHGKKMHLWLDAPRHIQVDGEAMGQAEELQMSCIAQMMAACA